MLRTSLSSCSTSLRVMGGKVRSGLGATAADGRTLDLATLVSQQRPLEDKDEDGHKEKVFGCSYAQKRPFSPLSKVHSCPFRLARCAPMQRAGLTHAPVVPSELVHVFVVEVEGDCGKEEVEENDDNDNEDDEEEEDEDDEDIEGDSRGQVGPHTPQRPSPPI